MLNVRFIPLITCASGYYVALLHRVPQGARNLKQEAMIKPPYTKDNDHFVYFNPNPSADYRRTLKWNKGDCLIRALSIATCMTWLETFDKIVSVARRTFDVPISMNVLKEVGKEFGAEWVSASPAKGGKRITAAEFALSHKKGSYVVQVSHHVSAVVDGKIVDVWDCGQKCVYGYLQFPQ